MIKKSSFFWQKIKSIYTSIRKFFIFIERHMKKTKLFAAAMLAVLVAHSFLGVASAADTKVTFAITAWTVTIGAPAQLTMTNTLIASFTEQNLTQDFGGVDNYFWVKDLKGAKQGYSTTLQMSGDLTDADGGVLSGSALFVKVLNGLVLVDWKQERNVVLPADAASYRSLWTAQTLINRPTGAKKPKLSHYGVNLGLQITIPGGQAGGNYEGTIVYTLTEL